MEKRCNPLGPTSQKLGKKLAPAKQGLNKVYNHRRIGVCTLSAR